MKITLRLDRNLIFKLRLIATQRETTLTEMVREHLEQVVAEEAGTIRQSELELLEESFAKFQFKIGKHVWRRANLYTRC